MSWEMGESGGPRVVVVGAGLAGVAAAGALRAGGIEDVLVLEASHRAGGRLHTVFLEGGFVELGAQFLHGKNDFYSIAERENMLVEEDPEEDALPDTLLQFREFAFRTVEGQVVDPDIVTRNLEILEELQSDAKDALARGEANDVNVSVADYFRTKLPAIRNCMLGTEEVKNAMIRWMDLWECQDSGGSEDQLSLPGTGRYVFYPGDGTRGTTQGLEAVFQCLLRESVPKETLRLNKPVKRILWATGQHIETPQPLGAVYLTAQAEDNGILLDANDSRKREDRTIRSEENKGEIHDEVCGSQGVNKSVFVDENESRKREDRTIKLQSGENKVGENNNEEFGSQGVSQSIFGDANDSQKLEDRKNQLNMENTGRSQAEGVACSEGGDNPRSASRKVKIVCEDGEEFEADHVIVTSSMGFLKEHPEFFQPLLPSQHQESIRSIGFGTVAKAFLIWDEGKKLREEHQGDLPGNGGGSSVSQWLRRALKTEEEEEEGIIPLWMKDDVKLNLKSDVYNQKMSNGRHWYQEVSIFWLVESHDCCLSVWVAGDAAIIMETLPVAEVKAVLHELLCRFLDTNDLPLPTRLVRTQWHSNRFTRGAYSYLATGVPLEMHDVLSTPLPSPQNPVLQLAGEACSRHFYSTAHGAMQSGADAARLILRHHNFI